MMNNASDNIPQVIAIVKVGKEGKVILKKVVRNTFGEVVNGLFLNTQDEILLTPNASPSSDAAMVLGTRLQLPEKVIDKLGLKKGSLLAMIQRQDAVALKKMTIEEREGENAAVIDIETPYKVTRTAQTTPMPDELLPTLVTQTRDLKLKYDIRAYLKGRNTFAAWQARQRIGAVLDTDAKLSEALIQTRLETQQKDGSWDNQVVLTARRIKELHVLGIKADSDVIQKAVRWILTRPQSTANPGMFFADDDLVAEQAAVINKRSQGERARFRARKRKEMKLVKAGVDLAHDPCGPRIMWPNALVIEVLLRLGYEDDERVQLALNMLRYSGWCECGYQHGTTSWRKSEPLTADEIRAFENQCIKEYRYGGVAGTKHLGKMDLSKKVGAKMPRIAHYSEDRKEVYALQMPTHQQPCELITTRALSEVHGAALRRLAEAHLWRFVARQHGADGKFVGDTKHVGPYFYLDLFARYNHPAAKVALMRSLPWVMAAQNADGSWGEAPHKDATTNAVTRALVALGDLLPMGFRP